MCDKRLSKEELRKYLNTLPERFTRIHQEENLYFIESFVVDSFDYNTNQCLYQHSEESIRYNGKQTLYNFVNVQNGISEESILGSFGDLDETDLLSRYWIMLENGCDEQLEGFSKNMVLEMLKDKYEETDYEDLFSLLTWYLFLKHNLNCFAYSINTGFESLPMVCDNLYILLEKELLVL